MKRKRTFIRLLPIFLIIITGTVILTGPAFAEENGIKRSFSTASPAPNENFEVTLTVSGLRAAGVMESLPEGFVYVSTVYPEGKQASVSGQNLIYSVLDEKKIVYLVKAPASGSGTFEGKWNDVLNQKEGITRASEISVSKNSEPAKKQGEGAKKLPAGTAPGILGALAAVFAIRRSQNKQQK